MTDLPIQIQRFNLIRTASGLTLQQKGLLWLLNDYQGRNEWAWPLQSTLARDCGFADPQNRQVKRLVEQLRQLGVLRTEYRHNHSTRYSINLQGLEALQHATPSVSEDTNPHSECLRRHQGEATPRVSEDTNPVSQKTPVGVTEDTPLRVSPKTHRTPLNRSKNVPPNPEAGLGSGLSNDRERGGVINNTRSPEISVRIGIVPGLIKIEWISQLLGEVELHLNNPVQNHNPFTWGLKISPELAACRLAGLFTEIQKEKQVKPTPPLVAAAINSREFLGIKALSWGWLATAGRDRLKREIIHRLPLAACGGEASQYTSPTRKRAEELCDSLAIPDADDTVLEVPPADPTYRSVDNLCAQQREWVKRQSPWMSPEDIEYSVAEYRTSLIAARQAAGQPL